MTIHKVKHDVFFDQWQYGTIPKLDNKYFDCSSIATLGSCFARNFSRWLKFYGYTSREMPWDIFYNPFSIQKEFERLYCSVRWEDFILFELNSDGEKIFRDPWRTWLAFSSINELKEANSKFDQLSKSFLEKSSGMVITLGLSEVWSKIGYPQIIFNKVPLESIRMGEDIFLPRFASVSEIYSSLEKIVFLIRNHISKNNSIIFTLSPIPLKFTSLNKGVRESNNISKASLLIALNELMSIRSDVGYFPSYEIVQSLTENKNFSVWQEDGRHVTAQVVDIVANNFVESYKCIRYENKDTNSGDFWIPLVDSCGKNIGKLYK